jgi:hypothetical protein
MSKCARVTAFGLAVVAGVYCAASNAAAQQNTSSQIEQKDFVKKLDDVRQTIERDRNVRRPDSTTGHVVADVCKRNPQLPQCKLN